MNNNDILFYFDAGCEIFNNDDSKNRLMEIAYNCNKYNMLYTSTYCLEKLWTKMDLFDFMNMKDERYYESIQLQATVIIIKKTNMTVEFIQDWYNISNNYHLLNDEKSNLSNDKEFNEHRHDQSIFSLLLKTKKYSSMNNENNILNDFYPIHLSRKRNG